jgi:hypothetical protein
VVAGNLSFPIATLAGVIDYDPDAVTHSAPAEQINTEASE